MNIIELDIERLGNRGVGIARHQGKVVFVPYTAPGDRVKARIVRTKKRLKNPA